jgi:hypothetical protein
VVGKRGAVVAGALLVLTALVSIDCLNLIHSEAWADLTRVPHLAAVHRGPDGGTHKLTRQSAADPLVAVVPAQIDLRVVIALWELVVLVSLVALTRPRFRPRLRGPPGLRFNGACLLRPAAGGGACRAP